MSPFVQRTWVIGLVAAVCMTATVGCSSLTSAPTYQLGNSTLPIKLAWETQFDGIIWNPVMPTSSAILLVHTDRAVYAVDGTSGKTIWQHPLRQSAAKYSVDKLLANQGNNVFVADSAQTVIQSLDVNTGSLQWEVSLENYVQAHSNQPMATQMVADDQRLYVLINLLRGSAIVALDSNNGDLIWQAPTEISKGASHEIFFDASTSLLLVDTGESWWHLDAATGRVVKHLPFSFASYRSPTYYNQTLFTSGDIVQAMDIATLAEKWNFEDECTDRGDQVFTSPFAAQDALYALTTCGRFYKLDILSGTIQWQAKSSVALNSFTIFKNTGYLLTDDGSLQSIDIESGSITGSIVVKPSIVPIDVVDALVTNQDLLVLSYGNKQLFAFEAK